MPVTFTKANFIWSDLAHPSRLKPAQNYELLSNLSVDFIPINLIHSNRIQMIEFNGSKFSLSEIGL